MSEKAINELRNKLSIQSEVIEHLLVRSELSLHLISAIIPTSQLGADQIKQKIEQFKYESPHISAEVLEMEKRKLIKSL
ncbi:MULTISPECIES: hypothetical protein [unclassified Serratia (in: enterobacteria)]|uniref:hypothetical protein n=1 Tax=unclassified Serratia (in: enterobacteria) TaxID=2647522 RepID=UPI0005009B14|nr:MULTISPECIES: hypothetical protein [unclassified Serratia (in: enterobacteria)]KFK95041.1 hypothetical protein IV04_21580 [Serratia sp. Ag1]KFK96002.1 hypothetical protein JV45_06270 [Serratia sp. Ag2]